MLGRREVVFCCVFLLSANAISRAGDLSVDEIIQGLADAEAQLRNFSLSARIDSSVRSPTLDTMIGPHKVQMSGCFDTDGRFRYELRGEKGAVDGKQVYGFASVAAFDSAVFKRLTGTKERFQSGMVGTQVTQVEWILDPRDYVHTFFGKRISDILKSGRGVLDGSEVVDGMECRIVRTTPKPPQDGVMMRSSYWVAPGRQFCVPRRRNEQFREMEGRWFISSDVEGRDYRRVDGVWLPRAASGRVFGLTGMGDKMTEKPFIVTDVSIEKWVINAELPPELFDLSFPKDVFVKDERTGSKYVATQIHDADVSSGVEGAFLIAKRIEQQSKAERTTTVVTLAIVSGLVALGVTVLLRKRAKRAEI